MYSCLDFFHTVEDEASQKMLAGYREMFPNTQYLFTAGSASTGMYRGIKLYEQAVIATDGDLSRDAVSATLDSAVLAEGPGGPAKMIPGTGHAAMNMYIAQNKGGKWDIISQETMVDPAECA